MHRQTASSRRLAAPGQARGGTQRSVRFSLEQVSVHVYEQVEYPSTDEEEDAAFSPRRSPWDSSSSDEESPPSAQNGAAAAPDADSPPSRHQAQSVLPPSLHYPALQSPRSSVRNHNHTLTTTTTTTSDSFPSNKVSSPPTTLRSGLADRPWSSAQGVVVPPLHPSKPGVAPEKDENGAKRVRPRHSEHLPAHPSEEEDGEDGDDEEEASGDDDEEEDEDDDDSSSSGDSASSSDDSSSSSDDDDDDSDSDEDSSDDDDDDDSEDDSSSASSAKEEEDQEDVAPVSMEPYPPQHRNMDGVQVPLHELPNPGRPSTERHISASTTSSFDQSTRGDDEDDGEDEDDDDDDQNEGSDEEEAEEDEDSGDDDQADDDEEDPENDDDDENDDGADGDHRHHVQLQNPWRPAAQRTVSSSTASSLDQHTISTTNTNSSEVTSSTGTSASSETSQSSATSQESQECEQEDDEESDGASHQIGSPWREQIAPARTVSSSTTISSVSSATVSTTSQQGTDDENASQSVDDEWENDCQSEIEEDESDSDQSDNEDGSDGEEDQSLSDDGLDVDKIVANEEQGHDEVGAGYDRSSPPEDGHRLASDLENYSDEEADSHELLENGDEGASAQSTLLCQNEGEGQKVHDRNERDCFAGFEHVEAQYSMVPRVSQQAGLIVGAKGNVPDPSVDLPPLVELTSDDTELPESPASSSDSESGPIHPSTERDNFFYTRTTNLSEPISTGNNTAAVEVARPEGDCVQHNKPFLQEVREVPGAHSHPSLPVGQQDVSVPIPEVGSLERCIEVDNGEQELAIGEDRLISKSAPPLGFDGARPDPVLQLPPKNFGNELDITANADDLDIDTSSDKEASILNNLLEECQLHPDTTTSIPSSEQHGISTCLPDAVASESSDDGLSFVPTRTMFALHGPTTDMVGCPDAYVDRSNSVADDNFRISGSEAVESINMAADADDLTGEKTENEGEIRGTGVNLSVEARELQCSDAVGRTWVAFKEASGEINKRGSDSAGAESYSERPTSVATIGVTSYSSDKLAMEASSHAASSTANKAFSDTLMGSSAKVATISINTEARDGKVEPTREQASETSDDTPTNVCVETAAGEINVRPCGSSIQAVDEIAHDVTKGANEAVSLLKNTATRETTMKSDKTPMEPSHVIDEINNLADDPRRDISVLNAGRSHDHGNDCQDELSEVCGITAIEELSVKPGYSNEAHGPSVELSVMPVELVNFVFPNVDRLGCSPRDEPAFVQAYSAQDLFQSDYPGIQEGRNQRILTYPNDVVNLKSGLADEDTRELNVDAGNGVPATKGNNDISTDNQDETSHEPDNIVKELSAGTYLCPSFDVPSIGRSCDANKQHPEETVGDGDDKSQEPALGTNHDMIPQSDEEAKPIPKRHSVDDPLWTPFKNMGFEFGLVPHCGTETLHDDAVELIGAATGRRSDTLPHNNSRSEAIADESSLLPDSVEPLDSGLEKQETLDLRRTRPLRGGKRGTQRRRAGSIETPEPSRLSKQNVSRNVLTGACDGVKQEKIENGARQSPLRQNQRRKFANSTSIGRGECDVRRKEATREHDKGLKSTESRSKKLVNTSSRKDEECFGSPCGVTMDHERNPKSTEIPGSADFTEQCPIRSSPPKEVEPELAYRSKEGNEQLDLPATSSTPAEDQVRAGVIAGARQPVKTLPSPPPTPTPPAAAAAGGGGTRLTTITAAATAPDSNDQHQPEVVDAADGELKGEDSFELPGLDRIVWRREEKEDNAKKVDVEMMKPGSELVEPNGTKKRTPHLPSSTPHLQSTRSDRTLRIENYATRSELAKSRDSTKSDVETVLPSDRPVAAQLPTSSQHMIKAIFGNSDHGGPVAFHDSDGEESSDLEFGRVEQLSEDDWQLDEKNRTASRPFQISVATHPEDHGLNDDILYDLEAGMNSTQATEQYQPILNLETNESDCEIETFENETTTNKITSRRRRHRQVLCWTGLGGLIAALFAVVLAIAIIIGTRSSDSSDPYGSTKNDDSVSDDTLLMTTTPLGPLLPNTCDFDGQIQPHVIRQCQCSGKIDLIANDTALLYKTVRGEINKKVYAGSFSGPRHSCNPANQALVWLSSGDTRSHGDLIQRFLLAVLYIAMGGANWHDQDGWLSDDIECYWAGILCNRRNQVSNIVLDGNNLVGQLPRELTNLENLLLLSISQNNLTGSIPSFLFQFPSLQQLVLSGNSFNGSIPETMSNATTLRSLMLDNNVLSGTIGPVVGSVPVLEELYLDGNQINGTLPIELGFLTGLRTMVMDGNQLTGSLPSQMSAMAKLEKLSLSGNRLKGFIPSEFGELTNLQELLMRNTGIGGVLDSSFGNLTNMRALDLGQNRVRGAIPTEVGLLFHLVTLNLDKNSLSGPIPAELGNLVNLTVMVLEGNQLTGTLPAQLGLLSSLGSLHLENNLLSGTAPTQLCWLRKVNLNFFSSDCLQRGGTFGLICPVPLCCTVCNYPQ